jgi:hypothetical protein
MGTVGGRQHAWSMTTSTIPQAHATTVARPLPATVRRPGDRVPVLALVAPLLLFGHGILEWVEGLGSGGLDDSVGAGSGPLAAATGALLVASVAAFAWLTTSLGSRAEHLPVAVPTALLAAFGAGATGAVWLGQVTGLLGDTIPTALSAGGGLLTGLALALVLAALAVEARMPVGSLALAGVAAVVLALPFGLGPLGSLLLLIALAPLTRTAEPA